MLDWGRWQTVLKHTRQSSKPSTVAVLVAMENVCFEQRSKHGGNAFVGSYPFLASMSGVHEDTVRNVVVLLEELGVVKVRRNYDVRRKQYSENYYTLLLIGGKGVGENFGEVIESEPTTKSVALSKEKGEASKCPAADAASPLALRHLDASHKQDKEADLAAKREAAAKYKAEQVAAAEERKRQEEAELAERKERERIENEQRLERIRLAEEKRKADQEAEKRDEEVVRLAMRQSVGSCVVAIRKAIFDEYDYGTLADVWRDYEHETFDKAVGRLPPDMSDKVKACMRNNPWNFE
jgi:flagellar biosynthesis GTPase FlhF